MFGFYHVEKEFDMYVSISQEGIRITIPSYDIYDKKVIFYSLSEDKCTFNYDVNKYILLKKSSDELILLERNMVTREELKVIFHKVFKEVYDKASERTDRREQLKEPYLKVKSKNIGYTYKFEDKNLELLREKVRFHEWINKDNEISMIKSILKWIADNIKHNGKVELPKDKRAVNLIEFANENGHVLNCRGLAIVANDLCLLAGLKSRFVVCMQKEIKIDDNHVVVNVFLNTLNKWVMMDPSYNAVLYSSKGKLLSVEEIREELRDNNELILNEEAEYYGKKLNKELYLRPLVRKVYRFETPVNVYSGCDKKENLIGLVPDSMEYSDFNIIDDPNEFWKQ